MNTSPENVISYCPKCGSDEFVFEGERSFLCGKCKFNFFINSAAAVAVLMVNDKGQLLLTKRAFEPQKGMLDLPGGFVDPGETVEEAAVREVKEELNLDVHHLRYLISQCNEYEYSGYTVYTTDLAFVAQVKSWDGMKVADDVAGYEWAGPGEIDYSKIGAESIKSIVRFWESELKKVQ